MLWEYKTKNLVNVYLCIVYPPLEHVQHPLSDKEATKDVDEWYESSRGSQGLDDIGGVVASIHQEQPTHSRDPWDGIGDGHERRVECWGYRPHGMVTDDARQWECGHHLGHGSVGRAHTQCHQASQTWNGDQYLINTNWAA